MRNLLQDNYSEPQSDSFSAYRFTIEKKFDTEQSKAIFATAFDYTIAKFLCQGDDEFNIDEEQRTLDTALSYTPNSGSEGDNTESNISYDVKVETDGYTITVNYNSSLYTKPYIESFASTLKTVISAIPENKRFRDIELASAADIEAINNFNATEFSYDESQTTVDILEEATRRNPDNLAVSYKDIQINYSEFKTLTDSLATYIQSKGIGKDDFVSVLINRNEMMAITAWGVVKAGAAYQPLDPTYPAERLNFMCQDSGARLLITERELQPILSDYNGEILYTDQIYTLPKAEGFKSAATPESAVVIIYTSGTTGTPKGCVLENHNVHSFFYQHQKSFGLSENSHIATYASFGFDAGVMDVFTTLMAGATFHVIPDDIRLDLGKTDEFYCKNGITAGFMTTQVGRMFAEHTTCKTLKHLMLGGEKLTPFTPPADLDVINGYGPSETLAYITSFHIKDDSQLQPIGKASYNTKLYVVDKYMRMLPVGACGELCIAGHQVGRGYYNRPDKTAEVFVKNPFTQEKGYERMYRTGDVVRYLPDGNIDFVGRNDGQVKIRGFRIELTEVEQVIRKFKGIKNATVQAFDNPGGGKFLAAYIVADTTIDIKELNAYIGAEKPPYMIPAVTMQIEKIPYNVNGKVAKRELPKPEIKSDGDKQPQTEMQKRLYKITADALGHKSFGIDTDLFEAGLTSIGSIQLTADIAKEFNITVQIRDLKECGNIEGLEKFIQNAEPDKKFETLADYPLTKTQEGIFSECMANPNGTAYNNPILLKLGSGIDAERLRKAVVQTVEAHPHLKTRIFLNDSGDVRLRRLDSDTMATQTAIQMVNTASIEDIKAGLLKPFPLIGGQLFRASIIKADEGLFLFIDIHHIVSDGASFDILFEDITNAYLGAEIEKEKFSGFEKSLIEMEARKGDDLPKAKAYYEKLLSGFEEKCLPISDLKSSNEQTTGFYEYTSGNALKIKALCKTNSLSLNGFFTGAFGFTMARYNALDYSVFATIYNGRSDSRFERSISMFVKTLPVVCSISDGTTVKDYVQNIANQLTESMANDIFSFAEICHDYGNDSNLLFAYQGENFKFESLCGEPTEIIPVAPTTAMENILLQVFIDGDNILYQCQYRSDLFSAELIEHLILSYSKTVEEFMTKPTLGDVNLLSAKAEKFWENIKKNTEPYNHAETVVDICRRSAKENAERTAVVYNDKSYTYAEVEDLTNRIASYVSSKGIGKNDYVSILIGRNEYMPITALGVVKAGAAYQPLDPTYPQERLNFMVADSGARLLIAERELRPMLTDYTGDVLYIDEIGNLPKADGFATHIDPDNAFVIIYTSGTTGTPKGCILEHKNLVCFYNTHKNIMELTNESHVANYASFGFDAGMMDLFTTLMAGATLYIIPTDIRLDIEKMDSFFNANNITVSFMTTQVGRMFAESTTCKSLRHFFVGGEKLTPLMPPSGFKFINIYGPTETTVYVTCDLVTDDDKLQPIGKALTNTIIYVVDQKRNLLPPGACGELCITGPQVGRGYYKRPDKTADVFVQNPFSTDPDYATMYRTGDIVRILPDGRLDFVGRRDGQVKIRGFRVELKEIEQVIRSFAGIKDATVQAFDSPTGGKFVAAYVVSDKTVDIEALHSFIGRQKPPYMVPAVTTQLESIPLNVNGKVDKRKLPTPQMQGRKSGKTANTDLEKTLCDIFASVLKCDNVYADDNFFEIGGSSISAAKVLLKCMEQNLQVVYKNIFDNPTPEKLAAFIAQQNGVEQTSTTPSAQTNSNNGVAVKKEPQLECNTAEHLNEISHSDIGDVLLVGATGFLGMHVLQQLLSMPERKIYCLVRGGQTESAESRLKVLAMYYFGGLINSDALNNVTIIDGDITDSNLTPKFIGFHVDTIINCAACVKHFDAGNLLERVNFMGVKNLIKLALDTDATLIHVSTLSVAGESVNGSIPSWFKLKENMLFYGQSLENKYIHTKFDAERAILDAIADNGLKAKIMRAGNLMSRWGDGEFQINSTTNSFMSRIKAYNTLGCFSVEDMDAQIEFSPIDLTAKVIVLLSGTPRQFTLFHVNNCHHVHFANIIEAMEINGMHIDVVRQSEFDSRLESRISDDKHNIEVSALLSYMSNNGERRFEIEADNSYTIKALYRLGFSWPIIDHSYIEKAIEKLKTLRFFKTKGAK